MAMFSMRFSMIRSLCLKLELSQRAGLHNLASIRHLGANSHLGQTFGSNRLVERAVSKPDIRENSIQNTKITLHAQCRGYGSTNSPEQNWKFTGLFISGVSALLAGFVFYVKRSSSSVINHQSLFSTVSAASIDDSGLPPTKRFNFIADVVEKAAPAVVFIEIKGRHPFGTKQITISNGSGFIVRADGLILTNAHVVANKKTVSIRFYNGKEMEGAVVAVDPVSDLAAIKVNATNLPVLKMGQSSTLRAGEWVIAMGSPLSLSNTVTCGIVSSVHRHSKDLGLKNKDMDYIQTDALINFGNSGGPLVNLDGEVIGINTMKVTAGISFAIPSDYASGFLSKVHELLNRGQPSKRQWFSTGSDNARRRFIGITMISLNQQLLGDLKTRVPDFPDVGNGVIIHTIIVGSPAFNGGLRAGDIITEINGKSIHAASDVYKHTETSESLAVVAFRGHRKMTFTILPEDVN